MRLLHWINNIRHYKSLKKNKAIYKQLGIKRSVLRSIDSRVLSRFMDIENPPQLSNPLENPDASSFSKKQLKSWKENGYIILRNHFAKGVIETVNASIRSGLEKGSLNYNYTGRKIFNAHKQISDLKSITHDPDVVRILETVFRQPAELFQTISFTKGSEQLAHSDSIHMTTIPLGQLAGVWVALEKIDEENGPLTYYPGSHKLPYILNGDYNNSSNLFLLDGDANSKYEHHVEELIKKHGLEERTLHVNAGDVLIWHANLMHGGAPIKNSDRTRKSIVSHYFAKDVLCFHEISERPAIM